MENQNFDINKYLMGSSKSIKDYILLIRNNFKPFLIISVSILILAIFYAFYAKNIYKSSVTLKINFPQQNVLQNTSNNDQTDALDQIYCQ